MTAMNRRAFAQTSLMAAGALALSPALASTAAAPAKPAVGIGSGAPDAILTLVDYCLQTTYEKLPADVVAVTKNQIVDTLGIALAGAREPGALELREFAMEMGGKPEARIWGTDVRVPAQDAARVNATASHALDFDDTYERSVVHPAVITVPAAFATADLLGKVSGKDLITAIALGTDVACRLANSSQPGVDGFKLGWHNTSIYGYFASAIVAGKLMGLDRDQLVSALGIVLHQVAGNAQAHVDGALTKRMGPGFGSYAGVMAARLAQRGVRGAKGVLEGIRGFYHQYHNRNYSREILFEGLGTTYAAQGLSFKPWPSCRGSHTAADAALQLVNEHKLKATDVEAITIYNGPGEYPLLDTPIEKKRVPTTVVEAQFSNPWVVATALVDGKVGLEHFAPAAFKRADLLAVTQRVTAVEDAGLARPGGGPGGTRIEMRLKDGRTVSKTVSHAKGEPNNPMSRAEFQQKFMDCTAYAGMGAGQATSLLQQIERLDTLADAGALTAAAVIPGAKQA